ncbi:MAG: cysteine rich repeat-containing protein [Pseudomonadota bacterium]
MRVKSLFAGALCLSFAVAPMAHSSDMLGACADDIGKYCSAVEAGHGRIAACLYAHELVISDSCDIATAEMSDILDTMFATIRVTFEQCSADIENHCSAVRAGGGRVLACLAGNASKLTDGCAALVSAVPSPAE